MIHYDLRCAQGHQFDGWFRDSATFDLQAERHLVDCPECGDTTIVRALMAPAVPRKGRAAQPKPPEAPPAPAAAGQGAPAASPPAAPPIPAKLVAVLQRMRAEVERNCDYVGDEFAAEARRIHQGESRQRGIYGEATEAQAEALAEDGITVSQIPWVPRADG